MSRRFLSIVALVVLLLSVGGDALAKKKSKKSEGKAEAEVEQSVAGAEDAQAEVDKKDKKKEKKAKKAERQARKPKTADTLAEGNMPDGWGDPPTTSGTRSLGGQSGEEMDLWSDPQFREDFVRTYSVASEIEPSLTTTDREQIVKKVLPLLSAGDHDAALDALLQMTTPDSNAWYYFTIGNLYFQEEQLELAARYYRVAIEKFPSYRRAHKNLGLVEVRTGNFERAITSLSRVVELGGGEGLVFGLLGYSYGSTEQPIPAESAYRQAMLLQPDMIDWKLGLTQSVLKQQKYGEAVTLTEELLARFPERSDYWLLQANAYIGLGQPLKAAENFEVVQRMGKATPASQNTLGDIYVNEGMFDLAARAYAEAVKLKPDQNIDQPLRRVEVLAQRGALAQAKTLLRKVEELAGDQLDDEQRKRALKLRSRIAVAEGQGDESVDVLEEIVALDPLDGEALILLGQHYARIDDPERAAFYYERAESIQEFEADARIRHAQLLVAMSKYPEAVPLLKRAQEIEPRDDVARYLEQVERLARTQR
jgi:tetratricopeptide (TPR) repeat protein